MRGRRKCRGGRRTAPSGAPGDFPSDSPKRKDSKLEFQGRLSHASPRVADSRITQYFLPKSEPSQHNGVVENEQGNHGSPESVNHGDSAVKSLPSELVNEFITPEAAPIECLSNDVTEDEGVQNEKLQKQRSLSPVTPHKMILVPQPVATQQPSLSPSSALSQLTIVNGATKKGPKSRRRLNPSQTANQLLPSTGSTLSCCNKTKSTTSNDTQPSATSNSQHKLTEYFPVRRSVRKTKKTVMEERQRTLEEAVIACKEEGLEIHNFEGKGRGILAQRHFTKGEFVVEYAGELIKMDEARGREKMYAQDQNTGCYMYYFKYRNHQYCVDATPESHRLGRLVNHSRNGNLTTKTITVDNIPRLVLIAKEDIQPGEEVTYDYGDRSKESLKYHPWLAS